MSARPLYPRRGFTLVEVLVASALLGASLIVMFGFHSQAVRANMNARRLTDCTYLAQAQMEDVTQHAPPRRRGTSVDGHGRRGAGSSLDRRDSRTIARTCLASL